MKMYIHMEINLCLLPALNRRPQEREFRSSMDHTSTSIGTQDMWWQPDIGWMHAGMLRPYGGCLVSDACRHRLVDSYRHDCMNGWLKA